MAANIPKTIARLEESVANGQYYEAQQQTRTIAARYTKTQKWDAAAEILSSIAQSLLKAGQGGSGGDLCLLMVDVYEKAERKPDAESRGRLLACLRLFDAAEPTRKKFIQAMIGCVSLFTGESIRKLAQRVESIHGNLLLTIFHCRWSAKFGEYPAGDPELHHVAGTLYAEEHEPYDAERHLILGTKDSVEVLTRLEYTWYKESEAPHLAPLFAARAVFPYLATGNVRAANTSLRLFTSALTQDNAALGSTAQSVSSQSCDVRIFPSLPLLNFLSLLMLAITRAAPELYRQLVSKYAAHLRDVEPWGDALDLISDSYFGIAKPRQSNPLFDMMGSLLGGGGGGGSGASSRKPATKRVQAPPTAEGLD
jgi:golgi to ER traffic protein 4